MNSFRQTLGNKSAAVATSLRGVSWIHGHSPTTSVFCSVVERSDEDSPRRITDGFRQMTLNHTLDIQIFVRDKVEAGKQFFGELAGEVETLILDVFMRLTDKYFSVLAGLAPFLSVGQSPLSLCEKFLAVLEITGIVHRRAVRECGEFCQTKVNANGLRDWNLLRCFTQVTRNTDKPLTVLLAECDIAHRTFEFPVLIELHAAKFGNINAVAFDCSATDGKRIIPIPTPEARVARFLSCFESAKEAVESALKVAKRGTGHLYGNLFVSFIGSTKIGKFFRLVNITQRLALHPIGFASLFKRTVVEEAVGV